MAAVCTKRRFTSQWEATQALERAVVESMRHPHGSGRLRREARAYECQRCGGWHLTSQPKRGAR